MFVYKIEKKKYKKTYPPTGSTYVNGRWSTKDMWVVYTSENIALAKLETLANSGSNIPKDRFLLILDVSEDAPLIEVKVKDLPSNWADTPYPNELSKIIKGINETEKYVGAIVPSAQSPRERNFLLLPDHPDFDKYITRVDDPDEYFDPRLK